MDGPRFDTLVKALGQRRSGRRAIVAGVAGVVPGIRLSAKRAEAALPSPGAGEVLSSCRAVGEPCKPSKARRCCTGRCNRRSKQCSCKGEGARCKKDRDCCSGGCRGKRCRASATLTGPGDPPAPGGQGWVRTCNGAQPFCSFSPTSCGGSCDCLTTTSGGSICAAVVECLGNQSTCTVDQDCVQRYGAGFACVPTAGCDKLNCGGNTYGCAMSC